jgi:hypothetical protein
VNIFNKIRFIASGHAIKRGRERTGIFPMYIKENLQHFCTKGEVILEVDNYRYIRFKDTDDDNIDLFFPCIKAKDNVYVIKTTLTWDMVEERLQNIIDKYHLGKVEVLT